MTGVIIIIPDLHMKVRFREASKLSLGRTASPPRVGDLFGVRVW